MASQIARWTIPVVAWLGLGPTAAAGPLGASFEAAARKNATLGSARLEALNQKDLESDARAAALLPTLEVTSHHGLRGSSPDTAETAITPWRSEAALTLIQPLYDNGRSWSLLREAKLSAEKSALEENLQAEDFALEFWRAWLDWRVAENRVRVVRARQGTIDKQFRSIQSQHRQGLKTRRDFLRIESERLRGDLAARDAEDALSRSREALVALGADVTDGLAVSFEGLRDKDVSFAEDLSQLPELRIAELELGRLEEERSRARRDPWPKLTLGAGAGYGSSSYLGTGQSFTDNDAFTWSLGLGASWTLFDGGRSFRSADIAARNLEKARLARDESERTLRAARERLLRDLERHRQSLEVRERVRRIEREGLQVLEDDYLQGRVTYLDLVLALDSKSAAEIAAEESLRSYLEVQGEIYRYGGRLYAWLLQR